MKKFFTKIWLSLKEWLRKQTVSLKRRPSNIVTLFVVASLLTYTLSMTEFSMTTSYVNGKNMGLLSFVVNLVSILSFIVILNVYPKRQKPRIAMLVILLVMMAIIVVCDVFYIREIYSALTRELAPVKIDKNHMFIQTALNVSVAHIVLIGLTLLSMILMPVYGKLLQKIDTTVASAEAEEANIKETLVTDEQ